MPARLYEPIDREAVIRKIEAAGRICYRSEPSPDLEGAAAFAKRLVDKGHESVLEHVSVSFIVDCSRACSHQLVRHRIASYSQESQRFRNVSDDLHLAYIPDVFHEIETPDGDDLAGKFQYLYLECWSCYDLAIELGVKPQLARYALPNAAMTRLMATANLRQWGHMIALRTSQAADEEIRGLFLEIQAMLRAELPEIFGEG
jgi:thymidylate synthase (FAD)